MRRSTILASLCLTLVTTFAAADNRRPGLCAPRPMALKILGETYEEVRQTIGLSSSGTVVELYAAEDERTWTILVTRPDGMSCILAVGTAFEAMMEALTPAGDPA